VSKWWCGLVRVNNFLNLLSLLRPRVRYGPGSHWVQLETRGQCRTNVAAKIAYYVLHKVSSLV
jgi:hypothetical protein